MQGDSLLGALRCSAEEYASFLGTQGLYRGWERSLSTNESNRSTVKNQRDGWSGGAGRNGNPHHPYLFFAPPCLLRYWDVKTWLNMGLVDTNVAGALEASVTRAQLFRAECEAGPA